MHCYKNRWIANYHEHETLLQENEAERLTKEEQDMAWLNFQRSMEWEEVHRTVFDDPERRPVMHDFPTDNTAPQQSKASSTSKSHQVSNDGLAENSVPSQQAKSSSKGRQINPRKCSNLAHLLTLRSQGTKAGSSTVCKECSQEISWENLNRDGRSK